MISKVLVISSVLRETLPVERCLSNWCVLSTVCFFYVISCLILSTPFREGLLSNFYFLIPGGLLFALPYLRTKQFKHLAFQMMILASTLLFVVLFSSGSESPTYIIAVVGVMIWYIMQKKRNWFIHALLIFVMVITCFSFSDIFPRYIKDEYIIKYSLKALPCALVWFRVIYELMTKDFEKDYQLKESV